MPIETMLYVSLGLNLALTFAVWFFARPTKPKSPSIEILEILHDISGQGTLLEIKRVDPMNVFTVSPHDRGR